jgi:DNA-binding NtrC family response regulator
VKLLRFLETRTIERVGGGKPIALDVRLVAATNRNLERMVGEGKFREDLFFRLNVVRLVMPPLRERADDIPLLLAHYLKFFAKENGTPPPNLEAGALRTLCAYRWPGNIRELRNFCENAVVMHRGGKLTEYDIDPRYRENAPWPAAANGSNGGVTANTTSGSVAASPEGLTTRRSAPLALPGPAGSSLSLEANEKRLLREALLKSRGNRTEAAKLMGVSRRTLHRKISQWPELDTLD